MVFLQKITNPYKTYSCNWINMKNYDKYFHFTNVVAVVWSINKGCRRDFITLNVASLVSLGAKS